MSLVVTGTVGIDSVYLPTGNAERVLGGSCVYFAAAAGMMGPVRMVAVVGEDFPAGSRALINGLTNVDSAGLTTRKGGKTFSWAARYSADMNSRETLSTELGVVGEGAPEVPAAYRDSRIVFLANMHPAQQLALLKQFPQQGLVVADTMDLWINIARYDLGLLLQEVDGLVLNFDEAELLTNTKNTVTAAKHLLNMGPRFVIVKKGEHGCLFALREGDGSIALGALPAFPTEKVTDPTGAGDSFAGGFMGYLASKLSGHAAPGMRFPLSIPTLRSALARGTVAASFTIEDFSLDRYKTLKPAEVEARLKWYAEMVRI
ncbi:MAG: sugar kinase [Planctomycetes bacterium]|nr:sugar kinase [Planctomycetota bacterium]